jgi:holin-like protein
MIGALALLLGCQLAGEALRRAAHLPVPGPVVGMLLLAALLLARPQSHPKVEPMQPLSDLDRVSGTLISHMGLLFVPAGVGVIAQLPLLRGQWAPVIVGLLGSTLIGLLVTALMMQRTLPREEPQSGGVP